MASRKALPSDLADKFFHGESVFFRDPPQAAPSPQPQPATEESASAIPVSPPPAPAVEAPLEVTPEDNHAPSQLVEKERGKEGSKFTSKLVNDPRDPAVNKVGYYFTRKEMDRLDALATKLKPILRDRFNVKMTKNEIIRACLAIGLADWEENGLTSKLVNLLTSK